MNDYAIKRLRQRYQKVALLSLVITMLFVAGFIYLGTIYLNRVAVHQTLSYLIDNQGDLIVQEADESETDATEADSASASEDSSDDSSDSADSTDASSDGKDSSDSSKSSDDSDNAYYKMLESVFSVSPDYTNPDVVVSVRYFAILFDENQNITELKTNHIESITTEDAETIGKNTITEGDDFGRIDNFYYQMETEEDGSGIVVYLDSTSILNSNERILYLALILIGFGMLISFFVVRIFATWAVRSEVRNAEIQKQFMTDASHEMKTPLAVIKANTEMREILSGPDEWTESDMRQVERLEGLIKNLIMISKSQEYADHQISEKFDASTAVRETVDNLSPLAEKNDTKLEVSIADEVALKGEDAKMRQLTSLLLDNAIKYCDENGTIRVEFGNRGRNTFLTISNDYKEGENVDYTKFFERFYRQDSSHNIDKGGYGIGLSVVEGIVQQFRGEIHAEWKDGVIYFICKFKKEN